MNKSLRTKRLVSINRCFTKAVQAGNIPLALKAREALVSYICDNCKEYRQIGDYDTARYLYIVGRKLYQRMYALTVEIIVKE